VAANHLSLNVGETEVPVCAPFVPDVINFAIFSRIVDNDKNNQQK